MKPLLKDVRGAAAGVIEQILLSPVTEAKHSAGKKEQKQSSAMENTQRCTDAEMIRVRLTRLQSSLNALWSDFEAVHWYVDRKNTSVEAI